MPTRLSAVDLVAALRRGDLTPVQVTDAYLARIARVNPHVRAVVRLNPRAREEAATATGPLAGLPLTLKDGYRVGGLPTTFGFPGQQFAVKPGDCELVRRMRAAGAVVLGRTAVPLVMFDWQCRTPLGRECLNPLDRRRTPGGSSGGAAAALAAHLTPLEIGSDLAGSIRYPAHCCGVVSLRPTVGLLPLADTGPDGVTPGVPSLAVLGPMARTLPDLQLLWDVLLADDDRGKAPPPPGDRLRVAVLPSLPAMPTDRATGVAFDRWAKSLAAAGHAVTVLSDPPYDFDAAYRLWGLICGYEFRRAVPAGGVPLLDFLTRVRLGRGPMADHAGRGVRASAGEYADGLAELDRLRGRLAEFFARFDLWALPVSPSAAIVRQPRGRPIRGHSYTHYLGHYLCPTTAPGTPAVTLPIGRDDDGMPVGAQIHGPRFSDRWLVPSVAGLG